MTEFDDSYRILPSLSQRDNALLHRTLAVLKQSYPDRPRLGDAIDEVRRGERSMASLINSTLFAEACMPAIRHNLAAPRRPEAESWDELQPGLQATLDGLLAGERPAATVWREPF